MVQRDYEALVVPHETMHSLSTEFHARVQLNGETLAEYSRVLMRLRNRMEKATATEEEGRALAHLRDTALKGQFIQGVREQPRDEAYCSTLCRQAVSPYAK